MLRAVLCFFVLLPVQFFLGPIASGQGPHSLYLGAGKPGSESFILGVGVTSLIKVKLLPSDGIDLTLVENASHDVAADLSIIDQKEVATLTGWEPVTRSERTDLRSIMTFNRHDFGAGPSLELITRADVPDKAIYFITKAILENGVFFEGLNQRSWDLSADKALVGLNLPLHPGAARYYEEIGEANLSAHLSQDPEPQDAIATTQNESTFFLDFGVDTTTLNQDAKRQIAEACQFATVFEAAKIEVAGYAGGQAGSSSLVEERERYVVDALRSNARCPDHVEIVLADRTFISAETVRSARGSDRIEVFIRFFPK